jgi:hypothetical protein
MPKTPLARFVEALENQPVIGTVVLLGGLVASLAGFWQAFSNYPLIPTVLSKATHLMAGLSLRRVLAILALAFCVAAAMVGLVVLVRGAARAKFLARDIPALERELDKALTQVAHTEKQLQTERSAVHGLRNHLEASQVAYDKLLANFGRFILRSFADDASRHDIKIALTVRYSDHTDDALVRRIQQLMEETKWPLKLEFKTSPPLRPDSSGLKVIFVSGKFGFFNFVASLVKDHKLLLGDGEVGQRNEDREEDHHLIVDVLPTAPK